MGAQRTRWCHRCGARLAFDNEGTVCSPCARRNREDSGPEAKDDGFWQRPAMAQALQSRHFGRVLYSYRYEHRPVLPQARLARWLNMTQAQVSRLERSEKPPSDLDKLGSWANTLHVPESVLWFRLPEQRPVRTPSRASDFSWFGRRSAATLVRSSLRPAVTVESIRETTSVFRGLDNRFGGGHARDMVNDYLTTEIAPALRQRQADATWCEFIGAAAELNQLAGWMAYDVGDTLSGRRYLQRALHMCQDVADHALSAEMLAGMSHHAAHAGDGLTSVGLARAARDTADGTGLAALQSETAVMEAHGLALLRDKRGSVKALRDAEGAFNRAEHGSRPSWLSYYDAAYLAAKMAHCLRELGELRQAERFARRSLEMSAGYDRGKLFNTALLASILTDRREIEEACTVGRAALQLAGRLHSARSRAYLRDFAQRLRRHRSVPAAADLDKELQVFGI